MFLSAAMVLAIGCSSSPQSTGSKEIPISVALQPYYHALPTYIAMQKGWDKAEGLKIDTQLYMSGPPENEALASNTWEVGTEGCVPAMLAAIRYGAYIIAVGDDDSPTDNLWVRPNSPILKLKGTNPKYPEVYGSAASFKGKTILLTTASNGHYAVVATLKALGVGEQDVKLVHMEPQQVLPAFEAGQGDIAQLFSPFDFTAEAKGYKEISDGKRAGIFIPALVVASKKTFDEHPEKLAKWLKLYLRGIAEMKADHAQTAKQLGAFSKEHGLEMTDQALAAQVSRLAIYDHKEQLALFAKKDGATSEVEQWMSDLADFFIQQGRITTAEKEKFMKGSFINDKILKMVAQ
jgi:NitT/TauT family transport system substrate-binding protein/sulfonate transport system substrate-binding protein